MVRRSLALRSLVNERVNDRPSDVARKSVIAATGGAPSNPAFALRSGSSKKNVGATCNTLANLHQPAGADAVLPFSYFCSCWKVTPTASPSFVWLMPSIIRRMRTRRPTCRSIGSGVFRGMDARL